MIIRDKCVTLNLRNSGTLPVRLVVEPWAEELSFPPGAEWNVVCESPRLDPIPIEILDGTILIFGVSRSMMRIFSGEECIWECFPALD